MPTFCYSSSFLLQGLHSHSKEQKYFTKVYFTPAVCSCSAEQQGCCREHCWSWGGRLHRRGSEFGQGCREVLLPSSWEKFSELGSPSGVGNLPSACWFPLISHVKCVRMQKWCVASRHSPVPAADFANFSDSTVCFGSVLTFRWGPSTTR